MRILGRAEKPVDLEVVEEVTPADLAQLGLVRGAKAPAVQRLRDSHHNLARLLACGMNEGEAALAAGYSVSRVSILLADPAFQNLLACYRKEFHGAAVEYGSGFVEIGLRALPKIARQIDDQLDDADVGEPLPLGQLINLGEFFADRLGHGKSSTSVNVNVNLADRIAAARQRAFGQQGSLPSPTVEASPSLGGLSELQPGGAPTDAGSPQHEVVGPPSVLGDRPDSKPPNGPPTVPLSDRSPSEVADFPPVTLSSPEAKS